MAEPSQEYLDALAAKAAAGTLTPQQEINYANALRNGRYSVDQIASNVSALPKSQAYVDQSYGGEDIRGNDTSGAYYGAPQDSYNVQDVQRAAQAIANSGQQLVQGNKVYDTGNRAVNEALYGPDIANNIGTDGTTGFRTPRQYDVGPGDYIKAGLEGVIQSYIFSAIGAPLIGKAGDALANTILPPDPYFANLAAQAGELGSNAGEIVNTGSGIRAAATIVGGIFGADYDIPEIRPRDITGSGGLYDMAILDRVSGPQLEDDTNNGGGGGGEPAPRPTEGGLDRGPGPTGGGEVVSNDLPPEQIEPNHEERKDVVWTNQNPDGSWVAGNEMGEVWEIDPPAQQEDLVYGVNDLEDNLEDIYDPSAVFGSNDPNIDPRTGEPYVDYTAVPDNGGLSTGGVGTGSAGQGTGSNGTGNGTDGTGDGDGGDGSGEGNGVPGMSQGVANTTVGGNSGQFAYSTINPSQAAQLTGMIDYVAALRGRR